jgi:hypothetical protein
VLRARGFIRFSPVEVENHLHHGITDAHGWSTSYLAQSLSYIIPQLLCIERIPQQLCIQQQLCSEYAVH